MIIDYEHEAKEEPRKYKSIACSTKELDRCAADLTILINLHFEEMVDEIREYIGGLH